MHWKQEILSCPRELVKIKTDMHHHYHYHLQTLIPSEREREREEPTRLPPSDSCHIMGAILSTAQHIFPHFPHTQL